MTDLAPDRQTEAELVHWQLAVEALADLDTMAAPEAWQALEDYLQRQVRGRLSEVVAVLVAEGKALHRSLGAGGDPAAIRQAVLRLRARYLQVETILDFFGDAVNSRTNPALRGLLRGYDTLAGDSMAVVLEPAGHRRPRPRSSTWIAGWARRSCGPGSGCGTTATRPRPRPSS